jgi:serine phosphatase RsbU (regulator of sigma subunit)
MNAQPYRVLLVESTDTLRHLLENQLEGLGHIVTVARDSEQAIAMLQAQQIDLVLLGMGADEQDYTPVLQHMRQHDTLDRVPALVVSNSAPTEQVEHYLTAGADDYLLQPLSAMLLQVRLGAWLRQRHSLPEQELRQERLDLLKYERDLQIGRQIQADFLPHALPNAPGWEVATRFQPARDVAGDFYDVFTMAQNRRIGIVLADVCGKGVGAALFMALFRSLIRAFAQQHHSMSWADMLSDTLSTEQEQRSRTRHKTMTLIGANALRNAVLMTNNYMIENHQNARMYATLFFGVLDPGTGHLIYVNGGHNPPLLINSAGIKAELEPTGPVVGIFPNVDFTIGEADLEPGDTLFVYTDGLPEALDPAGVFFSEERMNELVQQPAPSAADLLMRLEEHVQAHIGSAPQHDDITLLAVRRISEQPDAAAEPPPEPSRSRRRGSSLFDRLV